MDASRIKVLIIDDDASTARLVAKRLDAEDDITVSVATAPAVAVVKAKQEQFDVVITDLTMPGMDGLEVISALRAFNLDLPVILMTGNPSIDSAQRAVALGAFRYLVKPADGDELLALVRQATNNHRLALLKRRAARLLGRSDRTPGDRYGLTEAFESALSTLSMVYQPIVKAVDHSVFGHETFIRTDEERLPNPGALIDAAIELDRLDEVTRTVMSTSISMLEQAGGRIFINLLPAELALLDDDIMPVNAAQRLVIELSDNERFDKVDALEARIQSMIDRGFEVAVDDLGVGRAGLGSFALLSPLYGKIDMSLIFDIDEHEEKRSVVAGIIDVCHSENVIVIAEGVETEGEFRTCKQLGCDLLQGHFIAEPAQAPMPALDLPA